jgi:hypothetical protein
MLSAFELNPSHTQNTSLRLRLVAIILTVFVVGLTYVSWLNGNQSKTISVTSVSGSSLPIPHRFNASETIIPSEYDQITDLLTGNYLKQATPKSLSEKDFQEFTHLVRSNWENYLLKMGHPMMVWSAKEIKQPAQKVFYPFSGPDFTTLYQIYPNANHYVMTAQQRGERLVDLSKLNPQAAKQTIEVFSSAWSSFGHDGFFVTEYLFKYISQNKVKIGATTLIASFAHLHEFSIQKIVPIQINPKGQIQELSDESSWDSVRFYLVKDKRQVILDYVSLDLSDRGLKADLSHWAFFQESAQSPILLKAASHLPQNHSFTFIRDAMLNNAPFIVQDETGLDYLPLSKKFDTVLYGNFVRSYQFFSKYNQDLAKAYKDRNDERPLPFRVGYFKDGNYALIVATRKYQ